MMQIVPVGAQARRAAAVGRLLGALGWLGTMSMFALRLRRNPQGG